MKKSKRIMGLTVVLAVICAATGILTRYEEKKEEIQNSDAIVLALPTEEIVTLSWEDTQNTFSFCKKEDVWYYEADAAFPVSTEKIEQILSYFEAVGASFTIEEVEDESMYGLDKANCTIRLETEEQTYELRLGDFSKMDEKRYADIGDGNVYLLSEDPKDILAAELSEVMQQDSIPDWDYITGISVEGAVECNITYQTDNMISYSSEDVYVMEQNGEIQPLDTSLVTNYLYTVSTLNLKDYVTYDADEEQLEQYGLAEPELTIEISYVYTGENKEDVKEVCTLYIGQDQEELQRALEAEQKEEKSIPNVTKYVRVGTSDIVYELSEDAYETLTAVSYDDLRHKEVLWAEQDQIIQIDVTLEQETYSFTVEENKKERIWYYAEEEMDMTEFLDCLYAMEADTFTKELSKEKEEVSVIIYLDNEQFPQVEIICYRYDGTYCLVAVNGESTSLVERTAVSEWIETVWTLVLG